MQEDGGRPKSLIEPYGGRLVTLLAAPGEYASLIATAARLPKVILSERLQLDLELLAIGAFSPLDRFMGEADYRGVCEAMRLSDGRLFPIPITLALDGRVPIRTGSRVVLCDGTRRPLALLDVEEIFRRDLRREARCIYGCDDATHPVIAEMANWSETLASGPLTVLDLPRHRDFPDLSLAPLEVRRRLQSLGRRTVVAFNTRNPLHRVHEALTRRAIEATGGSLLLHPIVGLTRPGDIDPHVRVSAYRAVVARYYSHDVAMLAVLPLAMRMAGPREAVWHALIRRNYGASHFIVGRDHAGPGATSSGRPFFDPEASRALAERCASELGVGILGFPELVYVPDEDTYQPRTELAPGRDGKVVSGSTVRREIALGRPLPDWLIRPEAAAALQRHSPSPATADAAADGHSGSGPA